MAKEYVEREALMNFPIRIDHYDKEHGNEHFVLGIETVLEYAENLPTADVVEVRHGKWIDNGERDRNGVPKPFAISCSVCGSSAGNSWMRYCPDCGAKMDGGK